MAPKYLSELITNNNTCINYSLRNSSKISVEHSKNNFYDNSIYIKGMKIFDRIPEKIHC